MARKRLSRRGPFVVFALTMVCSLAGPGLSGEVMAQSAYASLSYGSSSCSGRSGYGFNCSYSGGFFSSSSHSPVRGAPELPPKRRWNTLLLERQGLYVRTPWAPSDAGVKFTVVNP
jgi:hypothetical protein